MVVEPHAVNQRPCRWQSEQTRLAIAGLGPRRNRAHLKKAESQRSQTADTVAVLVQPRSQTNRVGEINTHHPNRPIGHTARPEVSCSTTQQRQCQIMGLLSGQREKKGTGNFIQHGGTSSGGAHYRERRGCTPRTLHSNSAQPRKAITSKSCQPLRAGQ